MKKKIDAKTKSKIANKVKVIALLSVLTATFICGCTLSNEQQAKVINIITEEKESGLDETIEMMKEIEQRYLSYYVEDIDYDLVKQTTINAMISAFGDKYGVYLEPEYLYVMDNSLNNNVTGIGVLVRAEINEDKDYDQLYVIETYENSGAKEAGIEAGDIIIKANDNEFKYTDNASLDTFLNDNIRGKEGTTCTLTFIDKTDNKEKTVEVTRTNVRTSSVKYAKLTNDIGYIKITEFGEYTDDDFEKALNIMQNSNIKKIVFDLRDNTGGLLESVLNMIDLFLPETKALTLQDKDGNTVETYRTKSGNEFDMIGVCIVNGNTASAAELFTQTLHDYNITVTLGEETYGKGTVCTILPTSDGGKVSVSTSRYVIFSGYEIEGKGVTIDYEMKLSDKKQKISYKLPLAEDDLVLKAVSLLGN